MSLCGYTCSCRGRCKCFDHMKTSCPECGSIDIRPGVLPVVVHGYAATQEGHECDCGTSWSTMEQAHEGDRAVARVMAQAPAEPATFRFIRHVLNLQQKDFAAKAGVTPEAVCRWESGARPINPTAWALLCCMLERAP